MTSELATKSATDNDGKTEWHAVEKNVAATEPPRIKDIPSHAKFLRCWGGRPTDHHYLRDTMEYLETSMPEGRIIPGTFLDKMSSLKFKPQEMMPRMVHACLITQACGVKDKEKIGCTLTENMVKGLAASCKNDALKG